MDTYREGGKHKKSYYLLVSVEKDILCAMDQISYHDVSMESRATETGKRILQWKESKVVVDHMIFLLNLCFQSINWILFNTCKFTCKNA